MGSTGIEIPKEFSVRAVIGMLLQVLGLSWAFLRGKLVALIGEEKVAWAEKTVDVVKKFVTGGIAALWDWIKDQATSIKDMFIQGTKDWLLTTLVTKFVEWIASLLIPGGAILRLVQGIYNLVMWFVNNIQKILRWVNAVIDSLGNVAAGAISAAIGFIVNAMKIIIPVILDFFARLLNISGIVDAVKNIINKIAVPIHAAINKVIDWVVGWVKKMFGKGDKETKNPNEPKREKATGEHDTEVGKVVNFTAEGEQHHIWIDVKGGNVEVMVASHNPSPVIRKLTEWQKRAEKGDKKEESDALNEIKAAINQYIQLLDEAKATQAKMLATKTTKDEKTLKEVENLDNKLEADETTLGQKMAFLFKIFDKTNDLDATTIAEAQGKFQAITDNASRDIAGMWLTISDPYLYDNEKKAAKTKYEEESTPWLWMANYGKAVERYTRINMIAGTEFKAIGGPNNPDFVGKAKEDGGTGKYEKLTFDITTVNQNTINAHVYRENKNTRYKNIIITTYKRDESIFWKLINPKK